MFKLLSLAVAVSLLSAGSGAKPVALRKCGIDQIIVAA